jgi:hypothetical protein
MSDQTNLPREDLTTKQKDYSIFLPAISGFYSTYVGKQRHEKYVEDDRIPAGFENGIEGMNFLNPDKGYFHYKWGLYSAGHANLDTTQTDPREDMIRNRHPDSFILGDSGGFQIGKGVWEGDWRAGSGCDKAHKKRTQVLDWMESYMNYGMTLDVPGWVGRTPRGREATKITTYDEAVDATKFNFDYWLRNRRGNCKFLTVLQGDNHEQADQWYNEMKKFCDPKVYPNEHFNGWAMGSQNKCDVHLVLRRLVTLIYDGLLEEGKQDWIHYLGTSKLEWAMMFTDIQRAIRKNHNANFTISFDCASPFLATANGQVYHENRLEDRGKWAYKMSKCVDDKKYAHDSRLFRDAVVNDGLFESFIDSPFMQRTQISDICHYAPGDLNKIGKEGRTSWDSFSYAILMGHNVHAHIRSVQDGNELYDQGIVPAALVQEKHRRRFFRDLVDSIFSAPSYGAAMAIVDDAPNSIWYMDIVGSSANGYLGKKSRNASTMADKHLEIESEPLDKVVKGKKTATPVFVSSLWEGDHLDLVDEHPEDRPIDDSGIDSTALEQLEQEQK